MKLEIDEKDRRILLVKDSREGRCSICNQEREYIYYCEQDKRIYCSICMERKKACKAYIGHTDHKIDEVRLDG